MKSSRRAIAAAAIAGSMVAGGAVGAALFGPQLAGAQTTATAPPTGASAPSGGSFHSNEDPAHEAAETPQHEADESNGTFRGHGGGSNEDPTHEAAETPQHEADENARQAPSSGTPTAPAPSTSGASATGL